MTKKKKVLSYNQPSLFDFIKKSTTSPSPNGGLSIEKEFKAALAEDLRHACDECGRETSRAQVAARMTDYLGEEITLSMLNNWTASSHPHDLPADYLPAFVKATGGQRRAVEVLSRHSGLFMLPGPEALRAEIQRIDEDLRKMKIEKQKRMMFLKELEKK
ncbi:MAG TPA: hypothetical protein PLX02_14715 [Syntrophorhabdaceae bacterium]|nr:hypothetical protein [Syntrophorhabdaceae bacterium]HQM82859.1 hypothetical protein [Syntrophorhabdaceae bacterium]